MSLSPESTSAASLSHPCLLVLPIKRLGPKSMARFPLVMSCIGTNTRRRVDEVFAKAGLLDKLRIVFETSTKDLLLQYIQIGTGIAIVPISPRYCAKSAARYGDIRKFGFRDVSKVFGHEQIVILRHRHRREPPDQRAFREIAMENIH